MRLFKKLRCLFWRRYINEFWRDGYSTRMQLPGFVGRDKRKTNQCTRKQKQDCSRPAKPLVIVLAQFITAVAFIAIVENDVEITCT